MSNTDSATWLADLDHSQSEVIKMTRRIDSLSKGHTDHHNIQEYDDDDEFFIKKERVNYQPVQNCHHSVDENKKYDSSDSSVDSGIGSNDENHPEREMANDNFILSRGLSAERSIGKATIRYDIGTENKCRCDKICKKPNFSRIFLSISFVGNIVLLVVVMLLATRFGVISGADENKCPLEQLLRDGVQDLLCIPCDYLGSHVTTEDTLFNTILFCGNKFCCVRNAALQKFFLLMLQEGYTREVTTERRTSQNHGDVYKSLETWRSRKIAAHLYANITSLPEKLTWQTEDGYGSAFTLGLTLTPASRLKVPKAGFYFIYSAITFKCHLGSRPLTHMISRQNRGRPNAGVQPLLLSKTSECGPDGFYTSFLASVLKLTSNDELSVNLTDFSLSNVYRASVSNYFGVYLL
ncbi:hypothetical protein CHS0354_032330 [Potamilus streckersoni]|uniref:THD domain-containing protein n=1 Tax=Potamilus streckersoni TaxID=2493646 RepID=A0AAE0TGU9_9BIVA|nr:hypothetical protein CHS0354_032330 [Potamilus streckersoni]